MGRIEDVPLKISAEKLHGIYQESFWTHLMAQAESSLVKFTREEERAENNIKKAERIIQERREQESGIQPTLRRGELDEVQELISTIEKIMSEMDSAIRSADENIATAPEEEVKLGVQRMLDEAKNKEAEVGAKVERIRAEVRRTEGEDSFRSEEVTAEEVTAEEVTAEQGTAEAEGEGINEVGERHTPTPQPITPEVSPKRTRSGFQFPGFPRVSFSKSRKGRL